MSLFSLENVCRQYIACRRHKRNTANALCFEAAQELNLLALCDALAERSYEPGRSVCFFIQRPKLREVFAADFRDRVVHHVLVSHLETIWEPTFVHDSYACRKGKGVHAAVARLQQFMRQATANGTRQAWTLQLDIRNYFMSIDKARLFAMVDARLRPTREDDRGGAQAAIWSYGHRNVQGAALHPTTGELWVTEHGPQGGDELNLVRPGRNYGWPLVSYGCEYGAPVADCPPVGGASSGPGYEPPLTYWVPTSIAPSGMVFYTGSRYPEWRGQIFIGALAGQALWRIELGGNAVVRREAMLTTLGERIRDVRQGPDGWLYLLTDHSDGRILRVER